MIITRRFLHSPMYSNYVINYLVTVFSAKFQYKIPLAYSSKCSEQFLICRLRIISQPPIKHYDQTSATAVWKLSIVALNNVQLVNSQTQLETQSPPLGSYWQFC